MAIPHSNNCFVTEQLKISVHDNNQILKFIILPRKNILLGLDWLVATQAVINVFARTISFPSRTILLNDSTDLSHEINITESDHEYKPFKLSTFNENSDLNIEQTLYNQATNDFEDLDEELWALKSTPIKIPDFTQLSEIQNSQLKQLLNKYVDVFATSVNDLKTPCTIGLHNIDTGASKPIYQRPYRKSKF